MTPSWPRICNHPCPSKIRFRRNRDDLIYLKLGVDLPADFNPATAEFEVELESGGATVYTGTLQAGDVAKRGHKWQFLDRNARKGSGTRGGISFLQTTPNRAGVWRVQFKAYADLTTVVDPLIRVSVYVDGTKVYEREEIWRERRNGFLQDLGH